MKKWNQTVIHWGFNPHSLYPVKIPVTIPQEGGNLEFELENSYADVSSYPNSRHANVVIRFSHKNSHHSFSPDVPAVTQHLQICFERLGRRRTTIVECRAQLPYLEGNIKISLLPGETFCETAVRIMRHLLQELHIPDIEEVILAFTIRQYTLLLQGSEKRWVYYEEFLKEGMRSAEFGWGV